MGLRHPERQCTHVLYVNELYACMNAWVEAVHACIVCELATRMHECAMPKIECVGCYAWHVSETPLTEEIRLQIFGFQDLTIFSLHFWSDRDSVYTRENLCKFGDSREIVFDMYGDSGENWLEILAVVIVWSPISSVCGLAPMNMSGHMCMSEHVMSHVWVCHVWVCHVWVCDVWVCDARLVYLIRHIKLTRDQARVTYWVCDTSRVYLIRHASEYGVATISRLLKMTGLFGRI